MLAGSIFWQWALALLALGTGNTFQVALPPCWPSQLCSSCFTCARDRFAYIAGAGGSVTHLTCGCLIQHYMLCACPAQQVAGSG